MSVSATVWAVEKDGTMNGLSCKECSVFIDVLPAFRGRSESRENVDGGNGPSGTEKGGAREEGDFTREHGEVKTEQHRCELVCRRELHRTQCDWRQCVQLGH